MGRSRYKIYEPHYPYFITSSIVEGYALLSRIEMAEIVLKGIRFMETERKVKIHAYVLMPDHIHLIVSGEDPGKKIRLFKSYSSRMMIDTMIQNKNKKLLKRFHQAKLNHKQNTRYQIWQEGYHPKQLTSDEIVNQKIDYIHYNPVKSGFVGFAEHWLYSSAKNYAGGEGLIPVHVYTGREL